MVVTKIDMCPPNVLQETLKLLNRVLKSPGSRKIPVMVQTDDDVITAAVNFTSERQEEGILFAKGLLFLGSHYMKGFIQREMLGYISKLFLPLRILQ